MRRPAWTEFPLPEGSGPHDVAPAPDGTVWFTAQAAGALGRLDPSSGHVDEFPLGSGSAPHGVIVGPDGAPWVTDGGLNAILRVDPVSHAIHRYPAARHPIPRESQHRDLRQVRRPLVHRPGRHLRPGGPKGG